MRVSVLYPVQTAAFLVTEGEFDLIHSLYNPGTGNTPRQAITAIKFLRQQYDLGLKEAKDVCDAIGNSPRRNVG